MVKQPDGKKGCLRFLVGCLMFFIAIGGAGAGLGAYLLFGGDDSKEPTKPETSTHAPANPGSTEPAQPTQPTVPTSPTAPTQPSEPIPPQVGFNLALTGVVSGQCAVMPNSGVRCDDVPGLTIDPLGLAKLGDQYLIVECTAGGCVSSKGPQTKVACVQGEAASVFCPQNLGDRATFYSKLAGFANGCKDKVDSVTCTLRGGVVVTSNGIALNGVPIVVARVSGGDFTFALYAGQAWTEATPLSCSSTGGNVVRCA